jgi:chromosomal replication initiation ATPase DnaA
MVHGAYDNWIADTWCIGVEEAEDATEACQTLVVQVANQYSVQWLDLRLKRLILRTLQGLVGSQIGVRFQTDRQNPAS